MDLIWRAAYGILVMVLFAVVLVCAGFVVFGLAVVALVEHALGHVFWKG